MLKYAQIILLMLVSFPAIAAEDRVAVVVNRKVITQQEIKDRKNFLVILQNIPTLSSADQHAFNDMVIQSLIDEELMLLDALKHKIVINDAQIQLFIQNVEDSRKLGRNYFKNKFGTNKGLYNSFLNKMKGELVRSRLTNEIFLRQINVSVSEVNSLAARYGRKDTSLELREFSTDDKDDSNYTKLKLAQKLKSCDKPVKDKKISTQLISTNLSQLSEKDRDLINDLQPGDFSAIADKGSKLVMYQICSRKVSGLSPTEIENISNIIGNKTLNLKFIKYLETIRKKAYIKRV